ETLYPHQVVRFARPREDAYTYARVRGDFVKDSSGMIVGFDKQRLELHDPASNYQLLRNAGLKTDSVLGIKPRGTDQVFALESLLEQNVRVLFLSGKAASGKTFLAYAAAVQQILRIPISSGSGKRQQIHHGGTRQVPLERAAYRSAIVSKPIVPIGGNNLGALPGNLYEKCAPDLKPYEQAHGNTVLGRHLSFGQMFCHPLIETAFGDPLPQIGDIDGYGYLPNSRPPLELVPLCFIRGISPEHTIILLDEGQNATPYMLKVLLQRCGVGTKLIIIGDPPQTDTPARLRKINGFTYALQNLLGLPFVALVSLTGHHRNEASAAATNMKVYS
ncbi:MAG: PhoH family protein, partial [Candidatus Woesearchaeota archaeon]